MAGVCAIIMRLLVAIVLLASLATADDNVGVCAASCVWGGGSAAQYETGMQYKYQYEGTAKSSALGGGEESSMAVSAEVVISANTPCDLKLQVMNLAIEDANEDDSKWFIEAVEEHDLLFSYQHGAVTHLCPHEAEEAIATNFKRGILSALQMTVTPREGMSEVVVSELDVTGECDTKYTVTMDSPMIATKTKIGCHARSYFPRLPNSHYTNTQANAHPPFARSAQECVMQSSGPTVMMEGEVVSGDMEAEEAGAGGRREASGAWQKVTCTETVEVQRPFSPSSPVMASVTITSSLTLNEGPTPFTGNFSSVAAGNSTQGEDEETMVKKKQKVVSIVADLQEAVEYAEKNRETSGVEEEIKSILEILTSETSEAGKDNEEGEQHRPRLFASLVQLLSRLKMDEEEEEEEEKEEGGLEALWKEVEANENKRKVLLDAMLVCDSDPCHARVARLAGAEREEETESQNQDKDQGQDMKKLTPQQLNMWLAGLHLHTAAHPSLVTQLLDIAESSNVRSSSSALSSSAVMAASSVVHRLCERQPEECVSMAQPFLNYTLAAVGEWCGLGRRRREQEHIKVALRALGNAGVLPSEDFPERCYLNRAVPPSLRVTALQTYRRTQCTANRTKTPWKLLEDSGERSEVRVAAYLAMVPCAARSPGFFTRVHTLLEKEEVQQVYSFIWTHVKSLVEKPGPSQHDRLLSKLARHHSLPERFNSDAFRSSAHHRYAHFSEMLNLGGSVDANVVYSPDSYLPHQISANLTLDLLDTSFNFLDFGAELSGMESVIESFFGREGYFANEDILNVLKNLRPKRSVIHQDKIQEFQKIYDEAKKQRELGYGLKKEGQDMEEEEDEILEEGETEEVGEEEDEAKTSFYVRLFGNEVLYVEDILQYSPSQLLYKLLQEISTPRTFKIVDQEYMTPTSLGFPLRLKVNATASITLQHEHTVRNVRRGILLEGSVTPSVVAATDETLVVDGFVTSSGLKRSSTKLAKVNIGGRFSYDAGDVTEFQISVPEEEVAKVSSSVSLSVLKSDGTWEDVEGKSSEEGEEHCRDALEDVIGLTACTKLSQNEVEVDGETVSIEPYESQFLLKRTDSFKYYKLYLKQQDNIVETLFDTPGSSVDRKIHFLFNMQPGGEGGYIIIRGAGYEVKGQYKNTPMEQQLVLAHSIASKVNGKVEMSLVKSKGDSSLEYTPKLVLIVGADEFTLEGKLKHEANKETNRIEWDIDGTWKKEDSDKEMEAFGSASGNFTLGDEEKGLSLTALYGYDPTKPQSVRVVLMSTNAFDRGIKTATGQAVLEVSAIPASLTLDYKGRPDLFDLRLSSSLHNTTVSSEVVLKDITQSDGQDSQLTFSLASPQLNLDYKASGIYKVSDTGLQAEAELNLGESLKSKVLLTHLYEDDPLHQLSGLHLILDDFVLQLGCTVDMSRPERFLVSAGGTIGEGSAKVSLEADYSLDRPFHASLEAHASLGSEVVGLESHLASDIHHHNFTGRTSVKWNDWSTSLGHQLVMNATTRALKLSLDDSGSVELLVKTGPNQMVKVVMKDGPGTTSNDSSSSSPPLFMLGAERAASDKKLLMQLNITNRENQLLHLAWNMTSDNSVALGLQLLESRLDVEGQYNVTRDGSLSGGSRAKVVLPSGDSVSADLSLSYEITDDNERLFKISGNHEGSVIESELKVSSGPDNAGINFTLSTPHPDFQKLALDVRRAGGPNNLYSTELQLDEFKVVGEVRVSDPSDLLVKVEYNGGEECSSGLHLQHSQGEGQYYTLARLALTQGTQPWEMALNTSLHHSYDRQFLDTDLGVKAPVMPNALHFHGLYNITEGEVHLEVQGECGESVSVLYKGKKEWTWRRHLLHGLGKVEASWMDPLAVNVTYDHALGGINVNIDFQHDADYFSSWSSEFSSDYSVLDDIKGSFYLTHPDLQITMTLNHNQSYSSWRQQLDGSINTFTITYATSLTWNEYLIPTKAEGSLSLFNFFDHSLDLSLTHLEESWTHKTQVTGTLDNYGIGLEHVLTLGPGGVGGVEDSLQFSLRDIGATTGGISLATNAFIDLPVVNASLTLDSPWTDSLSTTFTVQEANTTVTFQLDATHQDDSLLSGQLVLHGWPTTHQSHAELSLSAVVMQDLNLKLQHNFNDGNLIFGDLSYGSDVQMQLGSHLTLEEVWYSREFVSYAFNASALLKQLDVDFESKALVDHKYIATLKGHWNENSLSVNSSILNGKVLEIEFKNPDTNYLSDLTYDLGTDVFFTLNFTLLRDGENLVLFRAVGESLVPKLDVTLSLKLFAGTDSEKEGTMVVTADLTKLRRYSLQGRMELQSDLFSSAEYGGKVDLDLSYVSDLHWKGMLGVTLHAWGWSIESGFNSSLEVGRGGLSFELGTSYCLMDGENIFDLKDMNVVLIAKGGAPYEMRVILHPSHSSPPWSLAIIYNPRFRTLKGFLSLAEHGKYELSLRLSTKTLTVDLHRVYEDDSKWQIVEGNINWIIKRTKQLVTLNMKSDIPAISKITGKVIVQRKRDVAVIATLKVNDEQFLGNLRLSTPVPGKSFRLDVKVDNSIGQEFESEVAMECSYDHSGFSFGVKIDLNQVSDWIQGDLKFSIRESYLKLKTPFPFFESFNATIKTDTTKEYSIMTVIEVPQFCWNLTAREATHFLQGSFDIALDLPCGGDSLFNFSIQYDAIKNPISALCELNAMDYGLLFKFNATGNLTGGGVDLRVETEVYPQQTFGLELTFEALNQYNLKLKAFDPPSNQTYFTFQALLSVDKAELTLILSEEESLLLKAKYDIDGQPLRFSSSLSSTLFNNKLTANLTGKATVDSKDGNAEVSFASNTAFSSLNASVTYSLLDQLKDINFKIETPIGDTDVELRILKDEDYYSINADMTSSIHNFEKYELRVVWLAEEGAEKLSAYLHQGDDIEYRLDGLRNVTARGTEANLNLTLPFEGYEHINLHLMQPTSFSGDKSLAKLTLHSEGKTHEAEFNHDPDTSLYQAIFNLTDSDGQYLYTLKYYDYSSSKHELEITLDGPELEGNPLSLLLKYDLEGLASAMLYAPHGQLGMEGSWSINDQKVLLSGTVYLTLCDLGEYHLDINVPTVTNEGLRVKVLCVYPELEVEMNVNASERLRTGGISLNIMEGKERQDYSLAYDFTRSFMMKGMFNEWQMNATLALRGAPYTASVGRFVVRSNLPGYEAVDATWEFGRRDWEYFGQASLEVEHQEVLTISITLNTIIEGAYRPWQNIRLTALLESPFTLPHHLHAEYHSLRRYKLLLYYQHGLDTYKVRMDTSASENSAVLELGGNLPIRGLSSFDIAFGYNFVNSYFARVMVRVEDSLLEYVLDAPPHWRIGKSEMTLTSPFLRPIKAKLSWSIGQESVNMKGSFGVGEHSGKLKLSLNNRRSSTDFECHITTSLKELSQLVVNLSYKASSFNNFDLSLATRLNDHGVVMKSSHSTKGGKLSLKAQGSFEILGHGGSLDLYVKPISDGYTASAKGWLPGYKKFSIEFYLDLYKVSIKSLYDSKELFTFTLTEDGTKIHFYWTDYWSFNLTNEITSKTRKYMYTFTVTFSGFGVDPIRFEASYSPTYSPKRIHQLDFSLTSSLLPPSTLQIIYSGNKVTLKASVGDKEYVLTGRANIGNLQSSFSARFESSDQPDAPVVLLAEYDLTDFLRGRMKTASDLAQIVLDWGEKVQVVVTGLRSGNIAKIDLIMDTPLDSIPQLHTGFHGEFFHEELIGFNCTAFVEWSERVEVTAIARMTPANVNVEGILTTSFPSLQKLSISFKLEPGQLQLTAQHNDDTWKAVFEYQFTPFSVMLVCSLETPVKDLEKISLSLSVKASDDKVAADLELSWAEGQTLDIEVEAMKWHLMVDFKTPWEAFTRGSFTASLKTEGELLTLSSFLELNDHLVEMSFNLLDTNFELKTSYKENLSTIGRAEFALSQIDKLKVSMAVHTPFEALKTLESSVEYEGNEASLTVTVNGVVNLIRGEYSVSGGEFVADIPLLNNFSWSLKAEREWLKAESSITLNIGDKADPLEASLSYDREPWRNTFNSTFKVILRQEILAVDIKFGSREVSFVSSFMDYSFTLHGTLLSQGVSVEIELEAPALGWELVKVKAEGTANFERFYVNLDYNFSIEVLRQRKEPLSYSMRGIFTQEGALFKIVFTVSGTNMKEHLAAITLNLDVLGMKISVVREESILFVLESSVGSRYSIFFPQELVVTMPLWNLEGKVLLQPVGLTASLTLPQPLGSHSLKLSWPDHLTLEDLSLSAELLSSYVPDGRLQLHITCNLAEGFRGDMKIHLSVGMKEVLVESDYHYDERRQAFNAKFKLASDWLGDYLLLVNSQWWRDISVSASLKAIEERHALRLHIDGSENAIELNLNSALLPARDITFTGRLTSPIDLTSMTLSSKLQADEEEIQLEARLESNRPKHVNAYAALKRNYRDIFYFSLEKYEDQNRTDFAMSADLSVEGLENTVNVRYYDAEWGRYFSGKLDSKALTDTAKITIINSHDPGNLQSIELGGPDFKFFIEVTGNEGTVSSNMKLGYDEIDISMSSDVYNKKHLGIRLLTTLISCEGLLLQASWGDPDRKEIRAEYSGNGEFVKFTSEVLPDDIFKYCINTALITSYEGYERFALFTPQHKSGSHSKALLEYPGKKVGAEINLNCEHIGKCDFVVSLNLPYENFDIVSLKYIVGESATEMEARVGKIGLTYSFITESLVNGMLWRSVTSLNEYSSKSVLHYSRAFNKRVRIRDSDVIVPKDLFEQHSFYTEILYDIDERLFFTLWDNTQEWVTLHLAWGVDKILTIVTPKVFPAFIHLNLEHSRLRNDYRLEFGLRTADLGAWTVYGLQLHQEELRAGHHLGLTGHAGEYMASFEAALSLDSSHFNNTLIFSLNENRLGYKALLLGESGLLTRTVNSNLQVLLTNRTLLFHTCGTASLRTLDFISNFTWNQLDVYMPPITLKLNYDDNTFFFVSGTRYLRAVLSHPDIEEISLRANLTRTLNSSLHGTAELMDGNAPNSTVVGAVTVWPAGEEHRMALSLAQPSSNFSVMAEGQLRMSPTLSEVQGLFSYLGPASEALQHLDLTASLERGDSSHTVTLSAEAPEEGWVRSWRGEAQQRDPGEATVSLEGSTEGSGDDWRLGAAVMRWPPQLALSLSVGAEEVREEARVRLGVHNPMEAGVVLDHFRFGQWHQEKAALGFRLSSPHVLQAFLQMDPSLDYTDPQEWAHLLAPAGEVAELWVQDVTATSRGIQQWAVAEAPAVAALFNNQSVAAVWQREAGNWEYFITDFEESYMGLGEDLTTLWEAVLLPVAQAIWDFITSIGVEVTRFLFLLQDSLLHHSSAVWSWLVDTWSSLQAVSASQGEAVGGLVYQGFLSLGESASVFFSDVYHELVWYGGMTVSALQQAWTTVQQYTQDLLLSVQMKLTDAFYSLLPYFDGLIQAFQSYGSEVWAEFSGPCLMSITEKAGKLAAMTQGVDGGLRVMTEFIQADKFSVFFSDALQWLKEKSAAVWQSVEGAVTNAVQGLPQAFSSWSPPLVASLSQTWSTITDMANRVAAEGFYPLLVSFADDIQSKVLEVPELVKEGIGSLHDYLKQFTAFESLENALSDVYMWGEATLERWSSGKRTGLNLPEQVAFFIADTVKDYITSTNYLLNHLFVADLGMSGHFYYNQYHPAHWPTFLEAPRWNLPTNLFKTGTAASEAEELMASSAPSPCLTQSLHPYPTATAIIAGQHVTTFDLKHFQFLGSCLYLLTKDFEGGDFEVFGRYRSLDGATQLEAVTVHGPNLDVTLSVDGGVISRGAARVETVEGTGFTALKLPDMFVSCHRVLRGCSITVSSKYFGRLGGLLGNYNGEASDDMSGPGDSNRVENAAQLATQWSISSTPCYQANQANRVQDYKDAEEAGVRECSQLFLYANSPLGGCFQDVDPHPYFTHCVNGLTHPAFTHKELNSPCTVVSAYRTQCWARNIHLPNLEKCREESTEGCKVEGESVPYGWSRVYEDTSLGKADVAIVVEQGHCGDGLDLTNLLDHLARQLAFKNINDVRYAVVGVGEDGAKMNSFGTKTEANAFLNELSFDEETSDKDIDLAIATTASELEWRPGVSRSLVLVSCDVCELGAAATRTLYQNDITLHLLSSGLEVEMEGSVDVVRARTRKLFGFDENLAYTPADYKTFRGSEKLRLAMRSPTGGCVAAALSTGGSVFDLEKWIPRRAIQVRKLLSVLGKRVALNSSPPRCQECQCLKGTERAALTCSKCFGDSVVFVSHKHLASEEEEEDFGSISEDIKMSFKEVFLEPNNDNSSNNNNNSTLRIA